MGLLKETMQAIIRTSENLDMIRKVMTRADDKLYRATYSQKPIEQVSIESREKTSKTFAYTEIKSIGGRICAIREYLGLLQSQLAERLAVNSSYISKLECGTSMPSETLIRLLSLIANIDETWLATGHLPQTTEEPAKPIENYRRFVTGNFKDGGDDLQKIRTMMGVVSPSESFPMGGYGERKPLQTLEQMKGQMENIKGFYSQTRQSTDTSTSDLQS